MKRFLTISSLILFFICGLLFQSFAQDQIIKLNGKKLNVQITEVSDTQIKYIEVGDPNKIIFTIDRALVKSVEFSYGKKMEESDGKYSEEYFINDQPYNIKLNFLALRLNAFLLTYEKAITPSSSLETSLKIFGLGFFDDNRYHGVGVDLGYKLKLRGLFKKDGSFRPDPLLHGSYLRPRFGLYFQKEDDFFGNIEDRTYRLFTFGIDYGKQWVINETLSFDAFVGLHYFVGSVQNNYSNGQSDDIDYYTFNGGDLAGGDNTAISFGIRLGYVFGKYGKKIEGNRNRR